MNKINISNAPAYTSPNSMTLICTEKPDGSTNLATLAFWAFASTNPGKIMFSLNKGTILYKELSYMLYFGSQVEAYFYLAFFLGK